MGSIWGHGSYVAPDWTADYLHREAEIVLDRWSARAFGGAYASLKSTAQAGLRDDLQRSFRTNAYDPATRTLVVDEARAAAFERNVAYYADVFRERAGRSSRFPPSTLTDPARARQLTAFFFWSSWAASTNRPGDTVTYTSNWPHEPLVGNRPTGEAVVWTGVSIILLLGGIGLMAFRHATQEPEPPTPAPASRSAARTRRSTPSQRATVKYFWTVVGAGAAADRHGRHHRALRCRRERLLRIPDRRHPAVHGDAHLAHAARHLLDRDGVARGRALHRAGGRRRRAEVPARSASTCCSARSSSWSSARWRASG